MIGLLEKLCNNYPVRLTCKILQFKRDTFYKRKKKEVMLKESSAKELLKQDLRERVKAVAKRWPAYGYRRVAEQLRRELVKTNWKAVARIMCEEGIQCRKKRSFTKTTDSNHSKRIYPNLAGKMSLTDKNQLWVVDITYIPLERGFAYLATTTDAFSRKILGWDLDTSMETLLCLNALKMALNRRKGQDLSGLVHHSDRGSQYASDEYIECLKNNFIEPSMSRKGNPYDNPIAERLFGTVKYEGVYYFEYHTFSQLYDIIKVFIDEYNDERLHSSIGYRPPNEFEGTLLLNSDQQKGGNYL